jgi:hypothetical protein
VKVLLLSLLLIFLQQNMIFKVIHSHMVLNF